MQRALPFPPLISRKDQAGRLAGVAGSTVALAALLLGLILRALLLGRPGLHPDEALYASWALRIADGSDPALLGVYVDKPPLLLYLLAALFRLAGFAGGAPPEAQQLILAGRLAALLASGVSLVLLWLIARRVHGPRVALAALALFAFSPLAVRLSPTLFTDPWLVLWMLLGLWAALERRAWLAGLACGLAFAAKQQAVLLIPLALAVGGWGLAHEASAARSMSRVRAVRAMWRWLQGFAIVAVFVLWWDSLRWQWMPSYWDRSAQTYGGVTLALDADLPQRLRQWAELLGYGFGWPLWLALAVLILGAAVAVRRRPLLGAAPGPTRSARLMVSLPGRRHWFDALLLAFVLAYLAVHLLTNLAPWDRYLLPTIPILALLLARGAVWACERLFAAGASAAPDRRTGWQRLAAAAALALALFYAAYSASFARLPLADGGAYDGVSQVAAHLRAAEPPGAILYHHWLGWHYGFYLYGAPLQLRWWQDAADLARMAANAAGQRQLIAFPAGRDQGEARAALARRGLRLTPVLTAVDAHGAPSLTLYHIEPAPAGAPSHVP